MIWLLLTKTQRTINLQYINRNKKQLKSNKDKNSKVSGSKTKIIKNKSIKRDNYYKRQKNSNNKY